jgi:hypothetical protein
MEQSFWKANIPLGGQEITCQLWNLKVTMFIRACYLNILSPEPVESTPNSHPVFLKFVILSSYLHLALPRIPFCSGSLIVILCAFIISAIYAISSTNLVILDFIVLIMFFEEYKF